MNVITKKKLVDEISGEILIEGDAYHDKINEQIEGFIKGLEHSGMKVVLDKEKEEKCDNCKFLYDMEEFEEDE